VRVCDGRHAALPRGRRGDGGTGLLVDARELEVTVAVDVVVGGGLAAGAGAARRGRVATRHAVDSRFFETLGSSLLLADCFFFPDEKIIPVSVHVSCVEFTHS